MCRRLNTATSCSGRPCGAACASGGDGRGRGGECCGSCAGAPRAHWHPCHRCGCTQVNTGKGGASCHLQTNGAVSRDTSGLHVQTSLRGTSQASTIQDFGQPGLYRHTTARHSTAQAAPLLKPAPGVARVLRPRRTVVGTTGVAWSSSASSALSATFRCRRRALQEAERAVHLVRCVHAHTCCCTGPIGSQLVPPAAMAPAGSPEPRDVHGMCSPAANRRGGRRVGSSTNVFIGSSSRSSNASIRCIHLW